jgi:hypothetical protein
MSSNIFLKDTRVADVLEFAASFACNWIDPRLQSPLPAVLEQRTARAPSIVTHRHPSPLLTRGAGR